MKGRESAGRGAASKTPFVAAIQINNEGKPLYMRLTPVASFTYEALTQWSVECLSSTARVVSDGLERHGATIVARCRNDKTFSVQYIKDF